MATIGSIGIAFDADTGGLTAGVDTVVSSLGGIRAAVEELRTQLGGLSSLSVALNVDTSGVEAATKSVASLKTAAASASAEVAVTADTSAVSEAAGEVESLGGAVQVTAAAASQARSSLAGLVVTTATVAVSAQQAVAAYAKFRQGFLDFITSTTGATTASGALRAVLRGLAGDVDSLRAVFGGVKAGVDEMVAGFLSASNINAVLQGTLGNVLRLFGATDEAVIASTQVIADLVTRQVSLAASNRLVQQSLQVVSAAYDNATAAIVSFLTETETGRAVADGLARGIVAIARAAVTVDSAIASAVSRVTSFVTSTELMSRVSATVGTAFDEVAAAARGLVSGTSTLGEAFAAMQLRLGLVYEGLVRLLPSFDEVAAVVGSTVSSMGRLAAQAGGVVTALGNVAAGLSIVSVAGERGVTALDFSGAVANTVALSAGFGALQGAAAGAVAGTGLLAGAASGAASAIAGLASTFPLVAAGSIAFAVATGKVADELQRLAGSAGQLGDLSDRFGQPVQEMEKLRIAANNTNTAFAAVVRGQQTFSSNIEKVKIGQLGTPQAREAAAAFSRLGISVQDLRSNSPETVFMDVAKAVSAIPDATKRTQVAMDLFGRTGPALMPLLKNLEAINADMERLGGTIEQTDFDRLSTLDRSFQRVQTASAALSRSLLMPFTRMQQAVNNLSADVSGGLAKAFSSVGQMLADISTPVAVVIEIVGRMTNVLLRVVGIFAEIATALGVFSTVAAIFEGIRVGFETAMAPIEQMLTAIEGVAKAITDFLGPTVDGIGLVGQAIGLVVGALGQLVTYVALGAAAWGIYSAAVAVATGFSIAATVSFIAMWAAALGPVALVVGGLALIGAGITLLISGISSVVGWFFDWGASTSEIDGATASVDELAAAVAEAESSSLKNGIEEGMLAAGEAASAAADEVGKTIGLSQDQVDALKATIGSTITAAAGLVGLDLSGEEGENQFDRARESIASARGEMDEFSIRAARLGQAGAEAITASSEEFNELQRNLASGKINLEEFEKGYDEVSDGLGKTLEAIEKGSPEETLKRNLELFKQLDDAAKQVEKSVRDIGAGVQIGDKFFPRSEEVKARAQEYADQYTDSLESIKRKLASGGFQAEIDTRRTENQRAFDAGEIDSETFNRTKRELDTTSAQEQASIATEEVQRELDRNNAKLKVELDFADNIRKSLETAFLSPVELFQKELDKIQTNIELTDEEKSLAEQDLRKNARESLIGKTAVESFNDRQRDLKQGADAGLISNDEMRNEMLKNSDELARALGIAVNPANQMEVAISELDTALKAGAISVDQHAEGLENARRSFLESLGIKPAAEEIDADKMAELEKQRAAGSINDEEFERGRQAIENDIVGQSAADRIAEQRRRIEAGVASGTVSGERGEAALRSLDADRRSAAGIENTAGQQLQLGLDRINDAFGVAGQTIEQIQANLSPQEFAEYQQAIKQNAEAVRESLGVEKSVGSVLKEAQERLAQAVSDGVITQDEANSAMKKQRDEALASLGIDKSPIQEFEEAAERLSDAAGEKAITEEELARGAKKIRENLLSSLGIPLDPAAQLQEQMNNLNEALDKGVITQEEFNRGQEELRESLGVSKSVGVVLKDAEKRLSQAVSAGVITQEEANEAFKKQRDDVLASLGIDKSPIQDFEEAAERLADAAGEKAITEEELARGAAKIRDNLLNSLGIPIDSVNQLRERLKNLGDAFDRGLITQEEFTRGQDEARKAMLPGGEEESPLKQFQRDMETINKAAAEGLIDKDDAEQRRNVLRADLQENLKPALEAVAPDRRQVGASDVRSRGGVDTFFRILQGRDNPSLKAQLEIARNTRILADAQNEPEAVAVIAQLSAR